MIKEILIDIIALSALIILLNAVVRVIRVIVKTWHDGDKIPSIFLGCYLLVAISFLALVIISEGL